jgi:hypothetical protein
MISGEAKKMIFIFLTHPRDLSGVYNRMTTEAPTMEQVVNYVRENPDCKSKDIAKHFGCTTKDINRNRGEYIGIYSNPAIISTDYKHRAKATEPEPEPEGNVCPICLEPPTNPVSGGCCPYPMCRECFIELENSDSENYDKCPHCRETFPWAMPDHDAIDEIVQERLQHIQSHLEDRLRDRTDQQARFIQAGDERILELERENQSLRESRGVPDQDGIDRSAEEWDRLHMTINEQTGQLRSQLQQITRLQEELARSGTNTIPLPEADEEIPMNAVVQQDPRVRMPVRLRVRNVND